MLLCLAAGGCAGLNVNDSSPPPRAVLPPPEGKKLAELVSAAFKTAKLPGTPQVSPVRATHDAQWGDWIFCIKSNDSEQLPKYAVLIVNDTILEVRSFVSIDGCGEETYHSIAITDQHGDLAGGHADQSPRSRHRY